MNEVLIDVYSLMGEPAKKDVDYTVSCILVELDVLKYNLEVIKALAVLLRSSLFKRVKNSNYYVNEEKRIYINEDALNTLNENDRELLSKAVYETAGIIVLSGESTVDLYYTVNCCGGTANSEDILGYRLNYLRRVLCRYCGDCQNEKVLAVEEIVEKVQGNNVVYKNEIDNIFKNIKRDDTGRIIELDVFGKTMSGEKFMETFDIPSSRVYFAEDSIRFRVYGEGKGLGLCLKGAEFLARQGMKYIDIIEYYYTGISFKNLDMRNNKKLLEGRTIVIDPGHGGEDKGNIHLNIVEKDINLIIALRLKPLLEETGARVILTRHSDKEVVLCERVKIINGERPNFFLSIHQNSLPSPGVNGVEAYCYSGDKEAIKLGNIIIESISSVLGIKNRGIRMGDYYLLRESRVSGLILETMYLTGKTDSMKYNEDNYDLIARSIFKAICNYYEIEP